MTHSLLKTTTSICLALAIAQPIPTMAWAQDASAQACVAQDGKPCAPTAKPDDKRAGHKRDRAKAEDAQARHDQAKAEREEKRAEAQKQQDQAKAEREQKRAEAQKQQDRARAEQQQKQAEAQKQLDRAKAERQQKQAEAQKQLDRAKAERQQKQAEAQKQQDRAKAEQQQKQAEAQRQLDRAKAEAQAQQTRAQDQRARAGERRDGQNRDAAARDGRDGTRDTRARTGAAGVAVGAGEQARLAAHAQGDGQRQDGHRRPPAFGSWNRDGHHRPDAASAPARALSAKGPDTRELRVTKAEVFNHSRNEFRADHRHGGLTDLEKFGLLALGAVAVGAVLSNGDHVVANTGDRVVVQAPNDRYYVYHDDDALLRRPGADFYTRDYDDGTVLTKVIYPDGTIIYTVRDADGRVLRRSVEHRGGRPIVLFDDTGPAPQQSVNLATLPLQSPIDLVYDGNTSARLLREAMQAVPQDLDGRHFALDQIRNIARVRYLAPEIDIASLNFASGSSAISNADAESLATLGAVMRRMVQQDPTQVFLVEGHADAVGDPIMNYALSDARAEAAAQVLVQDYDVPAANIITQGYGSSDLKEQTQGADPVNRRIIVRPIGTLLPPVPQTASN